MVKIAIVSFTIVYKILDDKSYADFIEKNSIKKDEAETWQSTLLQKAATSTCIIKNTYLLGKVMDARKKQLSNLYFSKFNYIYLSTIL